MTVQQSENHVAANRRIERFFEAAKFAGASEFARGVTNLGLTNVKLIGHRFRRLQGDPGAVQAEQQAKADVTKTLAEAIPERIVHAPNFLPAVFLETGALRARCVCKIETHGIDFAGTRGRWHGTGFLISDDLLLTNHHVLNSLDAARDAWCIFNFQAGTDGKPLETAAFRLQPERLFLTSSLEKGLDYTFVAIDPLASRQFGFIPMVRSAFTVHPGDAANIIQHPEGRHKEVTLQDNEVMQDTGILLHYASDTERGSSGSPVFNNRWELIALHHASRRNEERLSADDRVAPPEYLNEGIKISAIAADLEARIEANVGVAAARTVLRAMQGVDSLMGFFGALGRHPQAAAETPSAADVGALSDVPMQSELAPLVDEVAPGAPDGEASAQRLGVERLVSTYSSEGQDVDVAFWNVDWFSLCYREKAGSVAEAMVDLNVDVWVLIDCSRAAAEAVIDCLHREYDLDFDYALNEEAVSGARGCIAVVWNITTVTGTRQQWSADVDGWFRVDSQQFPDLCLEAVHGRVFQRYPALFNFRAANRCANADPFEFRLVPLALDVGVEGTLRRRLAARILAAAIRAQIDGTAGDWIIGGDFAPDVATGEFRTILKERLVPLSAAEDQGGAITYLKSATSLIDHIFLAKSASRTFGADDFFVIAERDLPLYIRTFAKRVPVLVRLSLIDRLPVAGHLPPSLAAALGIA